jgi:inner membrane protein
LENVTHSVVGLLVAEAAMVLRAARNPYGSQSSRGLHASAMLASVLANNAPDIDTLYAGALSMPIGHLLHHRGHTHTLVLSPLLAALSLAVTLGIGRVRRFRFDARETMFLFALALLGVVIHLSLDALNNYGVHPFWPFFDGWIYGDSIFIVEPWLWAALIPPLIFLVTPRWLKISLATVVLLGVGICWLRDFVPRSMALVTSLIAGSTALASRRATPRVRVLISGGAGLAVLFAFVGLGAVARGDARRAASASFPRAETHDIVLTPMPADPLCWQVLLVQTEGESYVARTGVAAVLPAFMAATDCPFEARENPTAPSERVPAASSPRLTWIRQFRAPLGELRALARESCVFGALLRFARAPFWTVDEKLGRVAGDIRFDRSAGLDFSDTVLDGAGCPEDLPPWTPPRSDILRAR